MRKLIITEICDTLWLDNKPVSMDVTIDKIIAHIIKNIDPTFPPVQFREWLDSDSDKPFHWNNKFYHWG